MRGAPVSWSRHSMQNASRGSGGRPVYVRRGHGKCGGAALPSCPLRGHPPCRGHPSTAGECQHPPSPMATRRRGRLRPESFSSRTASAWGGRGRGGRRDPSVNRRHARSGACRRGANESRADFGTRKRRFPKRGRGVSAVQEGAPKQQPSATSESGSEGKRTPSAETDSSEQAAVSLLDSPLTSVRPRP
jgi:hypothetical protein